MATAKAPSPKAQQPELVLEQYRTDGTDLYMVIEVGEEKSVVEDAKTSERSMMLNTMLLDWKVVERGEQ